MVRFIMLQVAFLNGLGLEFTFQYGQIYYKNELPEHYIEHRFTFQYGQIYYIAATVEQQDVTNIYIPIWLDLLQEY